jgi:hypothetical protein
MRTGYFPNEKVRSQFRRAVARHEIGHAEHLADTYNCPEGSTVMYAEAGIFQVITSCDDTAVCQEYGFCPTPTPTPTPTPEQPCFRCYGDLECTSYYGCPIEYTYYCELSIYQCQPATPILIDTLGNGFTLTNATNGVLFDLNGNGDLDHISWTSVDSDDAWLVMDRNGNGVIDSGREMFGNFTQQPNPPSGVDKNGFLALAEYDKPENGGNLDDQITAADAAFGSLRLWRDTNHNGISEAGELFSFPDLGLGQIDLDYRLSSRDDDFGNVFKYRAKVYSTNHQQLGRWAYDVILISIPPEQSSDMSLLSKPVPEKSWLGIPTL